MNPAAQYFLAHYGVRQFQRQIQIAEDLNPKEQLSRPSHLKQSFWYHGSPAKFNQFKLGQPANSRIPCPQEIHLTARLELAFQYSLNREAKKIDGYVYLVAHVPNQPVSLSTYYPYTMPTLHGKPGQSGIFCLKVTDPSELIIIRRIKAKDLCK